MSFIPLAIQGGLVGMVAGAAYHGQWQFWAIIVANAVLTVTYGTLRASEA